VGAREHRHVAVLAGQFGEVVAALAEGGHQYVLDGGLDEQAVGEVVHVLAGQPEVDPVAGVEPLGEALADEVLDGLHVVVGRRILLPALGFESFDDLGVVDGKALVEAPEVGALVGVDGQGRDVEVGEREQVLHLDLHAGTHERPLAGVGDERLGVARVPPVERRDGVERTAVGHTRAVVDGAKKRVEAASGRGGDGPVVTRFSAVGGRF